MMARQGGAGQQKGGRAGKKGCRRNTFTKYFQALGSSVNKHIVSIDAMDQVHVSSSVE
jgi:hypothetical protein